MGAEHLMPSREEYTRYLRAEFEPLQADPTGRLFEPIRPDGALFRLNLRALKSCRQGLDPLISYLLETARIITGSRSELEGVWSAFSQLCHRGQISNYDRASIEQFTRWLEELEYPAIHHSQTYTRGYQPAYRLIAARFIHELGLEER